MSNLFEYRKQLLIHGFSEAKGNPYSFYKELMPYTAFVVNLTENNGSCEIVYGCASTAFTKLKGNADALIDCGVFSEYITIRRRAHLQNGKTNGLLYLKIREMYLHFLTVDKESLMAESKELRKAFVSKFALPLKKLGLKKKGNVWMMSDGSYVFAIEKSLQCGDKYYFTLNGHRVQISGYPEPLDWQLVDEESLEKFISEVIKEIQNHTIY